MNTHRIERFALPLTEGTARYCIFIDGELQRGFFHSVLDALEVIESPEHPMEALAYTTLGEACAVPTDKQLSAARDGRDTMHAEIRQAEDNSWSWK
jgi:hypothetical protein